MQIDDQHGGELDERLIKATDVYNAAKDAVEPLIVEPEKLDIRPLNLGSEEDVFNVSRAQEETRAKIANYFTQSFLIFVMISLLAPFVINLVYPSTINDPLQSSKELVTTVASVLAGPFGFIVGFYFKQGQDNNG